ARDPALVGFAQQIRSLIARTYSLELEQMGSPFRLLDSGIGGSGEGGLVPQSLRDALFDARMSLDRERRQRWTLFVDLAKELEPELGSGQFDTAFDRASSRASLIYDTGATAIPVDRLGAPGQRVLCAGG